MDLDMTKIKMGYSQAYKITIETILPLGTEYRLLSECVGHISAENVTATVNSPSANTSLKDGYALNALSIKKASVENPIELTLFGSAAAGQDIVGERLQSLVEVRVSQLELPEPVPGGAGVRRGQEGLGGSQDSDRPCQEDKPQVLPPVDLVGIELGDVLGLAEGAFRLDQVEIVPGPPRTP